MNELKSLISYYCSQKLLSPSEGSYLPEPGIELLNRFCRDKVWCKQEVRDAARTGLPALPVRMVLEPPVEVTQNWGPEYVGYSHITSIDFSNSKTFIPSSVLVHQISDPLISGLRIGQLATGAHYKLRCLLDTFTPPRTFISRGDGSGGMTAALLRHYPKT